MRPLRFAFALSASLLACPFSFAQNTFVDTTAAANLAMIMTEPLPFGSGARGVATGDFDLDGDLDLIVAGINLTPIRYFCNDGTGVFSERTLAANLPLSFDTIAFSVCDFDNDGDPDLMICRTTGSELYENDGAGTFQQMQGPGWHMSSGTMTYGASWADFDNDGWLDVILVVWDPAIPNHFYRNNGGTGFTRMPPSAGLDEVSMSLAVLWLDYNEDGLIDVYTINDKGMLLHPNSLYENNGDGTFTDVSVQTNSQVGMWAMGADYTDAFNDGGQDIYVSDGPPDHLFLVWDESTGQYWHAEYALGMQGGTDGWAVEFCDYDNDGWQDCYVTQEDVPNALFRNPGAAVSQTNPVQWSDVGVAVNAAGDPRNQAVTVMADFDNDGRDDSLQVHRDGLSLLPGYQLLMNHCIGGNWFRLELEGTVSNRDGIGARIRVTANGMTQYQTARNGVGFTSATDQRIHFGLGTATMVDRIEVIWPSGQVQILKNQNVNQEMLLVEPMFEHLGDAIQGTTSALRFTAQGDHGLIYAMPMSFTPGSIPLPGGRAIPIMFDAFTPASLLTGNALAPTTIGVVSPTHTGMTNLHVPVDPNIAGLVLRTTAFTLDFNELDLMRTILPALAITIQ